MKTNLKKYIYIYVFDKIYGVDLHQILKLLSIIEKVMIS